MKFSLTNGYVRPQMAVLDIKSSCFSDVSILSIYCAVIGSVKCAAEALKYCRNSHAVVFTGCYGIHCIIVCSVFLFSWTSASETIDDRLTKLINCYEMWKVYEKHRTELMKLIADVEKLVSSLHAAVAGSETEHQHDVDRMHVCVITVL